MPLLCIPVVWNVGGRGTNESKNGPNETRPKRAMDDVAALRRSTGGGLALLTNAACRTGELELNSTVMKAIIARPLLYSADDISVVVGDDAGDNDIAGAGFDADADTLRLLILFSPGIEDVNVDSMFPLLLILLLVSSVFFVATLISLLDILRILVS